jgi:cytochrome c peroxidase
MTRASKTLLALGLACIAMAASAQDSAAWTRAELALIGSMRLSQLSAPRSDPSNAYENDRRAAELGKRLFFDPRFSSNGQVSCATCHDPAKLFQDGLPRGKGIGVTNRRTMPLATSIYGSWFFWDGRKDSLWSQALEPLEDAREHGGNRVRYARLMQQHYRAEYEALFGPLPDMSRLPPDAGPNGNTAERIAWDAFDALTRQGVSRVFVNQGKALAAFQKTLRLRESRFDRYAEDLVRGKVAKENALSGAEIEGLRIFVGKGKCATCHSGPLLTDHFFHSTRVPPRSRDTPDPGRIDGAMKVTTDEFNCLGFYSDAKPEQCSELRFIMQHDLSLRRAFKTPSLRDVAERAPYMHAGQIMTLEAVVRHYVRAPEAMITTTKTGHGHGTGSALEPVPLTEAEIASLVAFLHTLSGGITETTSK